MDLKKLKTLFWLVLITFVILLLLSVRQCSKYQNNYNQTNNLLSSIEDTLVTYKGRDGLNKSIISVLETDNIKSFTELKTKDSEIIALQSLVKQYSKQLKKPGSSATRFTSVTNISKKDIGTVNTTLTPENTVSDSIFIHYNLSLKDDNGFEWVYGSAIADNKYLLLDQTIVNEYSVIIGEESQGWFKQSKPFVEVTNHNPFSETTSLRTYKVKDKPKKKFNVGPGVYYGVGNNFQFQVFIGVGLQYNILTF